jgi:hypothetical protein
MYTLTSIINKIVTYIITNGNKLITAVKLNEILTELKNYISGNITFFGNVVAVAETNVTITDIGPDMVMSGVTLVANDCILLTAQTVSTENGLYVVPRFTGQAARHPDFATEAACHNYVFRNSETLIMYSASTGTYNQANNVKTSSAGSKLYLFYNY